METYQGNENSSRTSKENVILTVPAEVRIQWRDAQIRCAKNREMRKVDVYV